MIFNKNFDNIDTNLILNEIKNKGYFSFDEALTSDFIDQILKDKKIFIAPGTIFGSNGEGYIRFSLCIEESKIIEAIKRLKK